jgi:hypothetical protein
MRCCDPVGGKPDLPRFFDAYDNHFRVLPGYHHHLRRLLAGYSRGDEAEQLRLAFDHVVEGARGENARLRTENVEYRVFGHQGHFSQPYRDALVIMSFGLCLDAPPATIAEILDCCERGDPLLELLARAAAPGLELPAGPPVFPKVFDGLYEAATLSGDACAKRISAYLDVWYSKRVNKFSWYGDHVHARTDYVGYWCVEAAGVVAALAVEDWRCAEHAHYPRDLVRMKRRAAR